MKYPNELVMHASALRVGRVVLRNLLNGDVLRSGTKKQAQEFARRNRIRLMPMKESEAFTL